MQLALYMRILINSETLQKGRVKKEKDSRQNTHQRKIPYIFHIKPNIEKGFTVTTKTRTNKRQHEPESPPQTTKRPKLNFWGTSSRASKVFELRKLYYLITLRYLYYQWRLSPTSL